MVDLFVGGFAALDILIMFVGRETGPSPRTYGKKLIDQQPADPALGVFTEDVQNFAVGFGLVAAVLDSLHFRRGDPEGTQLLLIAAAGDKHLRLVGEASHDGFGPKGHINGIRLAFEDAGAHPDTLELNAVDGHVTGSRCQNDDRFKVLQAEGKAPALGEFDIVEKSIRHQRVADIDDGLVPVVMRFYVSLHGISLIKILNQLLAKNPIPTEPKALNWVLFGNCY